LNRLIHLIQAPRGKAGKTPRAQCLCVLRVCAQLKPSTSAMRYRPGFCPASHRAARSAP
jgi:hypothetical protein